MHIIDFLNQLPVSKLKDLARRHNAEYRIKIGQTRENLINDLAKIYKHYTGSHIVSNPQRLLVERMKVNITKKKPKEVKKPSFKDDLEKTKQILKQMENIEYNPIIDKSIARMMAEEDLNKTEQNLKDGKLQEFLVKRMRIYEGKKLNEGEKIQNEFITNFNKSKKVEKPIKVNKSKKVEKPTTMAFDELTKEQQKQAKELIKQREKRRKEKQQIQKEIIPKLQIIEKENVMPMTATDKALQTLIDMGLIDDKELQNIGFEKTVKKEKFSYNKDFVNDDKMGQEQLQIMEKGQNQFDFYKTPKEIINKIADEVVKITKKSKINILEPSAGIGSLITGIIDRQNELNINRLDAIELNEDMYNLLKANFNISNIYNENFMKFNPTTNYDIIIMNPPYQGYINEDVGRTKLAYLYHIMKAVLLSNNRKVIYAVIPNINNDKPQFEFDDILTNTDKSKMKKLFKIDDIPKVIVQPILKNIQGWKKIKFSRGKLSLQNAGLSLNLYKFIVV
jgi:predicted RNA methylase